MDAGQAGSFPLQAFTANSCLQFAQAMDPHMGNAQVAQLVEHATENRGVGGSIPPLGTTSLTPLGSIF